MEDRVLQKLAKIYKLNLKKVPLEYFKKGILAELEHKDITHGDIDTTVKIVLAHLKEFPDYYQRLEKLEKSAEKFWKNKNKNIFTN